MSEAEKEQTQEAPETVHPKCPHCEADPLLPQYVQCTIGPIRMAIFFCKACRKVVPVFLLPSMPQGPRIVPPTGFRGHLKQ